MQNDHTLKSYYELITSLLYMRTSYYNRMLVIQVKESIVLNEFE